MLKRELDFHAFYSTGWVTFCLLAAVAAIVMIVILMRYERKLVSPRVGNTLLLLRLLVVVTIFFTLLEPVLSWTLDREQTGRILVAVDLSESMDTTDNHAKEAEKLRWARALGMIGNARINDRLDRWVEAFELGKEPPWVLESETSDPEKRRELQRARKENLQEVFDQIDRLSRKEIALRLLTKTESPLLSQLTEIANVELVVFAGKSESANAETLGGLIEQTPRSVLTGISDLSQALLPREASVDTSRLVGVVVLTDGRDNAGRDLVAAARRLGESSAPVFPILLGSERRPKDLAIAGLEYPQSAFKDDKPVLRATLNTSGFEGEELNIVLEQAGEEPITKTVTPDGDIAVVQFELSAEDVGRHEFTIRSEVRPGETREDNNSKSFAMTVVDDTVRVLLLEGEARWEFRFIDNALARDERVDVKRVVYRQPYLGVLGKTFFPRTLKLPQNADDLEDSPFAEPELVILGDVSPFDLPEQGWALLEKFVAEAGGTLVLIAGKRYFPLSHQSEIVDRLLPVTDLRPINITAQTATGSPTDRGFHLQLSAEGNNEPMFQFHTDPVENRKIWDGLPGHMWGLLGKAKPGATVFAHAVPPNQNRTLESERQAAIIVQQHYGFGQVLWIGIDSTWRWRYRVGDQYHHRFWGQLGRWAAENKASAGNEFVKFGPDQSDIEVGDDAVIRARWTGSFLQKSPNLKAKAKIFETDDDEKQRPFSTVELRPVENRPLIFEGRAVSLPAGSYEVKLVVEGADFGNEEISSSLYVNPKQTPEISDLSSNRELLMQLADVSDGRLFLPDEIAELPELFKDPNFSSTIRQETSLWDHWFILLVFFVLLTSEWVIRKLNGLP